MLADTTVRERRMPRNYIRVMSEMDAVNHLLGTYETTLDCFDGLVKIVRGEELCVSHGRALIRVSP